MADEWDLLVDLLNYSEDWSGSGVERGVDASLHLQPHQEVEVVGGSSCTAHVAIILKRVASQLRNVSSPWISHKLRKELLASLHFLAPSYSFFKLDERSVGFFSFSRTRRRLLVKEDVIIREFQISK
ncbi:unnamed protein product [Amoebophrya sp. A25]|nr:unnamed protein product [Amoebophrya sp. A25]|eukprot:GSA25T00028022001.1